MAWLRSATMPSCLAMATAVSMWSPVIMTVRIPASCGLADSVGDLGTDRVDHAGQAAEDQIMLERCGAAVGGNLGVGAACQRQHAQSLVGHGLVGCHELGAALLSHGDDLIAVVDMGAQANHHVGRALGVLLVLAVQGLDDQDIILRPESNGASPTRGCSAVRPGEAQPCRRR